MSNDQLEDPKVFSHVLSQFGEKLLILLLFSKEEFPVSTILGGHLVKTPKAF